MNNSRLTFNSSTNFTLPIGAFYILERDAYYYGYVKNEKPNISGFLNELIPVLSDYQEELYKELLKYNNGNTDIAKIVARSIHNVYLKPFNFHDDAYISVPFRISKDKYNDFEIIHDERLRFYDTDFTNYIRTLLVEYASKTFAQREYLYAFRKLKNIREAIIKNKMCRFYSDGKCDVFVPVSIEASPVFEYNYIVGITNEYIPMAIRLSEVYKIVMLEEKMTITEKMCMLINEHLENIYEEESAECSD